MTVYVLTKGADGEPDYDVCGVYASESLAETVARNELQAIGVDSPNVRDIQGGKLVNCDGITRFSIFAFRVEE